MYVTIAVHNYNKVFRWFNYEQKEVKRLAVIPEDIIKEVEKRVSGSLVAELETMDSKTIEAEIDKLINVLYDNIDDKKRISYGITYVINTLSKMFYQQISDSYSLGLKLYKNMQGFKAKCLGLGLLSFAGLERPDDVLPLMADAASGDQWETKEFVQMFVRKIMKKHSAKTRDFLSEMAKSENPDKRRLASESLRPVAENKWINDDPEFSLSVLRLLFRESHPFPRVSVGNNLSDLSRKNPELIFAVVEELIKMHDKNSEIIAYRACRNLVITNPIRVLDALGSDEYKYKNRIYKRDEILRMNDE